jgi:ATP-dependent exoDNAse (exonuclease V) beta subunit
VCCEGFGEEAKSVYDQKQEELLDNINVLYVALTRGTIICHFKYELTSKGEVKTNDMSTFFINYLMN